MNPFARDFITMLVGAAILAAVIYIAMPKVVVISAGDVVIDQSGKWGRGLK